MLDIPVMIGTYPLKDGAAQTKTNDAIASDEEESSHSKNVVRELPSAPAMSLVFDGYDSAEICQNPPAAFPQDGKYSIDEGLIIRKVILTHFRC